MYHTPEIELEIPDMLWNLVRECEIYCEAACCGENAFELFPETMQPWVSRSTVEQVAQARREVDELIAELARLGPTAGLKWFSGDDPAGPRAWLEDVRECLIETTAPPLVNESGSPMVRRIAADVHLPMGKTYLGQDYWTKPIESGVMEVLLPGGPLRVQLLLAAGPLQPGATGRAEIHFPLPRRIQPWLKRGSILDLAYHRGDKVIEATVVDFLG